MQYKEIVLNYIKIENLWSSHMNHIIFLKKLQAAINILNKKQTSITISIDDK